MTPNATVSRRCPFRQRGQRHGHRGRGDEHQHAGRVGAALRVDVRVEQPGDQEGDGREDEDQRAYRAGPVRRHPVPGQVARHQVEQAGHRRRAGEPEDRDRRDVVGGAERGAEVLVGQVGQRPAVGGAAWLELVGGISNVVTKLVVIRKTLMITAAVVSSRRVPLIRPAGFCSVSVSAPVTSGMTATPVSNPDRPSASLGNTSRATPIMTSGLPYLPGQRRGPVPDDRGVADDVAERDHDDDDVERQVDADQRDRDADRLGEALQEHRPEQRQQDQRDQPPDARAADRRRTGSRRRGRWRRRRTASS